MRRKCLVLTTVIVGLLMVLYQLGIPLTRERTNFLREDTYRLDAKVLTVEEKDQDTYRLVVRLISCAGERIAGEKVLLTYYDEIQEPWELIGAVISFEAKLDEPNGRRNPGCFDYKLYLKSRGINHKATISEFSISQAKLKPVERLKKFLIKKRFLFADVLPGDGKGIIMGILFGDTSLLDEDTYRQFQQNGTAHILAVSGLHIGILYGIYKKIVGRRKNLIALACLIICLFGYGTIALWSASVIRATLLIGIHITADYLDLRYDMLTGLSTVALILIIQNPYAIFGTGFQMSFLAVLSICFLSKILPGWIPDILTIPVSVNLGLMMYQMYQFNYISFVAIAANIPILLLAGILVPVALLSFGIFAILGYLGPLAYILDSLSFILCKINELSTLGGYGSLEVASPPLWTVFLFYFLLFFITSEYAYILRHRKKYMTITMWLCCGTLAMIICGNLWTSPISSDEVIFVDVGQGDCIHIRDGNRNMLIDGGGSIYYNVGKNTLKAYLLKNGVGKVDVALATHLHSDHFRGLQELDEVYRIDRLLTGMTKGRVINLSEKVRIETLWPVTIEGENGQDDNSQCSVFMIYYGNYKILITGDLDQEGERQMIAAYAGTDKLAADILKIGHHGSTTSTCDEFLEAVNPTIAVIQVGAKNIYGHPDGKIIEKCLKKGIMVVRNDENGAIGFSLGKDSISCHLLIDQSS